MISSIPKIPGANGKVPLKIYITPELKERLKLIAKRKGQSLTKFVGEILKAQTSNGL